MIQIINYGLGNLGSVQNMLKRINVKSRIVESPGDLTRDKFILPGVGSFDTGMRNLVNQKWVDPLSELVQKENVRALGICLGMQLMTKSSQEGVEPGLAWIDAEVLRFQMPGLKTPHMGWNIAKPSISATSTVFNDENELRFYFVHSYYVKLNQMEDELYSTTYGFTFTSGFAHNNIYGVQFHPEKSHKFGMALLNKFAHLND